MEKLGGWLLEDLLSAADRNIVVRIAERSTPPVGVSLPVEDLSTAQRMSRGLNGALLIWAMALVALFIPLLHFVLVPALLVAGPLVGFARFRRRARIGPGDFGCPACGSKVVLEGAVFGWPAHSHCGGCGGRLELLG